MKQINLLVSLYSFIAFVVIIERLSFTTKLLLQPYNYITLHEYNQTVIFLLATTILSVFILRSVTNNFQTVRNGWGLFWLTLFIGGVYLYGAGEGWHEVASFTLNRYCDLDAPFNNLCGGLFINDYYAGNIIFFIGGVSMNLALLALSYKQPIKSYTNKDLAILLANSVVYAFTWFAYAAFDVVLVGLFFSGVLMVISLGFFYGVKNKWREYPYITYSAVAYTLSTLATLLVKFH